MSDTAFVFSLSEYTSNAAPSPSHKWPRHSLQHGDVGLIYWGGKSELWETKPHQAAASASTLVVASGLPKRHHIWLADGSWALTPSSPSPLTGVLLFLSFILSTRGHFVKTTRPSADLLAKYIQSTNLLSSLVHSSSPRNFLEEIVTIFLGFCFSDN